MDKQKIIDQTARYIRDKFSGEGTGHDWWHIKRVWDVAKKIGAKEKADLFVVELGALLHDIADFKFHGGDELAGSKAAWQWLEKLGVDEKNIKQVCHIVDNVSFKGAGVENKMESLEGKVVQDADRLDALGAIGIARAFAYGGSKHRLIYSPGEEIKFHETFEEYKKGSPSSLNHVREKILYLDKMMNTKTGKKMAKKRHKFVEQFIKQFMEEWGE